ncbi:PfkB family carbohydrate kinase [Micromonospora sp. NPDC047740]|uniref:PfkB family carbohydrate kinase n=1 Tax=Micromonospora sp. NPDC047740 TaxID=3364254 RepID=UPI00371D2B02
MNLAGLGLRVAWCSRVGADPLGELVTTRIGAAGVDVSLVEVDPTASTGVFFKDLGPHGTNVHYYRRGSAAAAMDRMPLSGPSSSPACGVAPTSRRSS